MTTPTILGLDIGGANLKAATPDKRAVSVPFPLWKQPDMLPAALAELVGRFPGIEELAVTMTGELCDCYETKRDGVNAIVAAARFASAGRRIRVWSTDGAFLDTEQAKANHLKVAAANWHALATYAGRLAPDEGAVLIDIGSTTTDIIPLKSGIPDSKGKTDWERLKNYELVYVGVRRTPVSSVMSMGTCAELFATTQDVFLVLGLLDENHDSRDTADARPFTREYSLARLARMLGGDRETISDDAVLQFADMLKNFIMGQIEYGLSTIFLDRWKKLPKCVIASGPGEFLVKSMLEVCYPPRFPDRTTDVEHVISLNTELGPAVSACAPAYAVAVLAAESRS